MYVDASGTREVEVLAVRYTPQGLMYELRHETPNIKWMTPAAMLQPINGTTKMARFHLINGEIRDDE